MLRLHAQGIIACEFFVAVTATFRLLYVFVVIEHHSRRLIHCNVTAHPNAAWTLQQLREAVGLEGRYEYLLHDRDSIFAKHLDESIERLGVKVLRSPPRSPVANAVCERVIGTIRRECLDWLIPLSESHLRRILKIVDSSLQYRASSHGAGSRIQGWSLSSTVQLAPDGLPPTTSTLAVLARRFSGNTARQVLPPCCDGYSTASNPASRTKRPKI
jgi:transposase InsO family protein